uniref:Uncharacterized protein n=1 Tax=Trichogramma kaykai TaxID=54128 RepID=A0ABD2WT38_9HYME
MRRKNSVLPFTQFLALRLTWRFTFVNKLERVLCKSAQVKVAQCEPTARQQIKILEVSDLKYDNAPEFLIFDLTFKTTNILLAVVYMRSHCTQIRRITKSDISNNNYLTR